MFLANVAIRKPKIECSFAWEGYKVSAIKIVDLNVKCFQIC